jgi:hypothetical protein
MSLMHMDALEYNAPAKGDSKGGVSCHNAAEDGGRVQAEGVRDKVINEPGSMLSRATESLRKNLPSNGDGSKASPVSLEN